jgi:predicted aminopeptidase
MRARVVALALGAAALLQGCSSVAYLARSAGGHLDLMCRARPVSEWLADERTPPALRERLQLAERMRAFAVSALALPDNASYRRYADLHRDAVVWNVVAAPELSLVLRTWCFPLFGCVAYRGYFDHGQADALAAQLRREGWEVDVYGVPAYSTLGWSNWLGGDPLLSTFVNWPEGELARILFHELAHQVVYVRDDTAFNESYATAVERLGVARWLELEAGAKARAEYAAGERRRSGFRALTGRYRAALQALYGSTLDDAAKRERKAALMAAMRAEYADLKAGPWAGYAGYDAWFARANNATLGVQAAYDDLVPAFERLFRRNGGDFARFHAAVKRLAALPKAQRRATLAAES